MMTRSGTRRRNVRHARLPHAPRRAYAMHMPNRVGTTEWTVEELASLPDDGNRYEVVDGELLVTPAPSEAHQDAAGELYHRFRLYLDRSPLHVFIAPCAVTFSRRREVQPDVFVLPAVDGKRARTFREAGQLELAVEVLSPSSARADRYVKRRMYQSERVPEYWIVDVASRLVERWHPDDEEPEVLLDRLTWQPLTEQAPLVLDLEEFFRAVHGE